MKRMKRTCAALLAIVMIGSAVAVGGGRDLLLRSERVSAAAVKPKTIRITDQEIREHGARRSIQIALNEAKEKGTARQPYQIQYHHQGGRS